MSSDPSRAAPALVVQPGRGITYSPVEHPPIYADSVPPVAPVAPAVITIHGESRIDEYAWMRHRDDPRVVAYLEAENAYTQ